MNARLMNILKYRSKNINQIVKDNYSHTFMSNSKWFKLIDEITKKHDIIGVNFKLIYDDIIESNILNMVDCLPYFIEPIKYSEVEWIEFPNSYEDWINRNNFKAGKRKYFQDIDELEKNINLIGDFSKERNENSFRIYGYQ